MEMLLRINIRSVDAYGEVNVLLISRKTMRVSRIAACTDRLTLCNCRTIAHADCTHVSHSDPNGVTIFNGVDKYYIAALGMILENDDSPSDRSN